jgi:hypothetical protein
MPSINMLDMPANDCYPSALALALEAAAVEVPLVEGEKASRYG